MKKKKTENIESLSEEEDLKEAPKNSRVSEQDIEEDIYLHMPPKAERIIKARVRFIGKAKPRIIIDNNYDY